MNHASFTSFWKASFHELRIKSLDKRWVTIEDIMPVLAKLPNVVSVKVIGTSVEGRPIHKLTLGSGNKSVLAWATMHGNESTSMRGWLDLFFNADNEGLKEYFTPLLKEFTLHFIPLLNPDGAQRYARRNALGIDMNRDACALQTPEMRVLKSQIDEVQPVLAFNLHDQRNIFAIQGQPATISFLAPSMNAERSITTMRERSMDLIGAAVNALEPFLQGSLGRYSDEYYPTAIGELVQSLGVPTILVECGAALNDPFRQMSRMANPIILHAILYRFTYVNKWDTSIYTSIPVNETNQVDILIRGIVIEKFGQSVTADLALLAEESIREGVYQSILKVSDFGDLHQMVGLETYHCKSTIYLNSVAIGTVAEAAFETDKGRLTISNGQKM